MTKNIRKVMGSLNIDFSNFDVRNEAGEYVYRPPDVIPMKRKHWYIIGWTSDDIADVEEQLSIYTAVPLLCKGAECDFANECPLVSHNCVGRWVGQGCPLEKVDAFRHFAGYVNDLSVSPGDYSDIQMINDLIRLQIQLVRCDKLIRKESPVETMVMGTDSKTNLTHNARQPSQLMRLQGLLRQDINKHYRMLLASREARKAAEGKSGNDAATEMALVLEKLKKLEVGER
jgi:hypothetical protein